MDILKDFIDANPEKFHQFTDDEMISEVKDGRYYAFADRLVKKANNNGGGDNITVVAIAK